MDMRTHHGLHCAKRPASASRHRSQWPESGQDVRMVIVKSGPAGKGEVYMMNECMSE